MIEPLISATLRDNCKEFEQNSVLECEYQIDAVMPSELSVVEASVLWYTEGKGDEDFGVHYFHRRTQADAADSDLRELYRFTTALPNSPLSYAGEILQINWCVRIRITLKKGKEFHLDLPFDLTPSTT